MIKNFPELDSFIFLYFFYGWEDFTLSYKGINLALIVSM